jgi:hypothetical protein
VFPAKEHRFHYSGAGETAQCHLSFPFGVASMVAYGWTPHDPLACPTFNLGRYAQSGALGYLALGSNGESRSLLALVRS